MIPSLLTAPVAPIDKRTSTAFVCPGGLREIEEPVYPSSPRGERLRALRVEHESRRWRRVPEVRLAVFRLSVHDHIDAVVAFCHSLPSPSLTC